MKFPEIRFSPGMLAALDAGLIGCAGQEGTIPVRTYNLRDFGLGNYRQVDDTPYGGGSGMVMRPEPIAAAIDAATAERPDVLKILTTPQGERFDQPMAREFVQHRGGLLFIAGRYEGGGARIHGL